MSLPITPIVVPLSPNLTVLELFTLMAGGCITYISLCIFLCVHRLCFYSGESAEPENEICERNFAIGAKLKTKVCVIFKCVSFSFVVTHNICIFCHRCKDSERFRMFFDAS